MKFTFITTCFLSTLAAGLSLGAQAVIIDGTFKGTVLGLSDNGDNNNPYFIDFFSDNLVGENFSGSFWYDTDLAPANMGTNGQWRFTENTNWLGVTFYVDGKTLNPSVIPENSTLTSSTEIHHISDINGYTGIRDFTTEHFGIDEFITASNGTYTSYQSAGISFLDSIIPSLSSNSLLQEFTWHDLGGAYESWDDIPGLARYFVENTDPEHRMGAGLFARLSEISVKPRNSVEVPEPSALLLLALGMMAFALRTLKFKTTGFN